MKKKVLLFTAMFLVIFGMALSPARTAHAKQVNLNHLSGKYYVVYRKSHLSLSGKKVHIKGYLNGYGNQKDAGNVNKSFRLAKKVKYCYGQEVNELVTNHRISKKAFNKRLRKPHCCVDITFKNGKATKLKIVYD